MAPVLSIHKNMPRKYFHASFPHMISYAGLKMCSCVKKVKGGRWKVRLNLHGCWSWLKGHLFCSQFGNQLIADFGELLNLLILQVRNRWWRQITNTKVMHIQKSVYLLKDSSFQRFHLHLLLPQAGVERNSLGGCLGTNLRYLLIRSVLKVVKERRILNEEMQVYCKVMNNQNKVLLIQFLLSVHFECLISLLLLFDPHQVILCTLL